MTRRSLITGGVALALRQNKVDEAIRLIQSKTESGDLRAAVLHVRQGREVIARAFGAAKTPDAVFLLASISKPMTASAVMLLVDRGKIALADPVKKHIPELQHEAILVRHLLTHTSGLPDMLPENEALRKRHAPLKDFVAATCKTPLLFAPGTQIRYQSMGILLAAEIVERVVGRPLPDFLHDEIYAPLGMKATSMGLGGRPLASTMQCQVDDPSDWDWNSAYWRNLASPWGGAHAPAADIARFMEYFVRPEPPVLKPATAASMIVDQTGLKPGWGLGWMLMRGGFGHSGSTGTLAWLDPKKDLSFVLLTTRPSAVSGKMVLNPAADLIGAAAE
jgi:CubicO group peptidase (beta-lactamase class C family)